MSSLPIYPQPSDPRSSRASKWRATVLIGVHLLIALHITHWLITGRSVTPVEPSEAMAFTKAGIVNAGLIFFSVTIVATAIFGRWFCGWACHLVALQDLSRWLLAKIGIRPQPLRSRLLRWVPALAFVYMFLWPLVYRLWIGDSFSGYQSELTTEHFWATFPGWLIGTLTLLICGSVIVYFLGSKGFCTYACPYGAIYTWADRVAPMRIRVNDACEGCGHCTATCSSNVRVHAEVRQFGMVVDDGCMKCLDCVSVCPNDALYYGSGPSRRAARALAPPLDRPTPLTWTDEIVLAVGFTLAFFVFRGLYGAIPFLMALGLSAVLSFLVLTTYRLITLPHVSMRQLRLKSAGRLLPAGIAFAAIMSGLALFWAHSGAVRWHQVLGERHFEATSQLRRAALDITAPPPTLADEDLRHVVQGRDHLVGAEDWGLLPTPGNSWRLAWMHLLIGSPADLLTVAQSALERHEYPNQVHHVLAVMALREGRLDEALGQLGAAVEADPSLPRSHLNLGLVLVEAGHLEEAREAFERGMALAPSSPELRYNAGLAAAYAGEISVAIDRFRETLELDPENLAARENLAGLLASRGLYEESVLHYRTALQRSGEDSDTHFLLARALIGLGDVEGALIALQQCLTLEPGHQEAIILRASVEAQRSE